MEEFLEKEEDIDYGVYDNKSINLNIDNPYIYDFYNPDKEVLNLMKNIRIVKNDERRTSEFLTKFEFTEVVSQRAKHIESGSMIFTDYENLSDPISIAKKEIFDKKCPLSIIRMYNDMIGEIWQVNELHNRFK